MSDQEESSVLFNLRELMTLEEDRVRAEQEDHQRKIDDQRRAREDAERKRIEEEQARLRAEEDARMEVERKEREEIARREREREEVALRVKLETEQAARYQEQERLLAHEREIEAIRVREGKSRSKLIVSLSLGALALVVVSAIAVYVGVIRPNQLEAAKRAEDAAALAQRQQDEARRAIAESEAKMKELQGAYDRAQQDGQQEAAKSLQEALKQERIRMYKRTHPKKKGTGTVDDSTPFDGDTNDPIGGLK